MDDWWLTVVVKIIQCIQDVNSNAESLRKAECIAKWDMEASEAGVFHRTSNHSPQPMKRYGIEPQVE
uniref:Uncharacterized protein n=1 Tax=Oryza nivara TaxID=4536 RepID=A0A0E0FGB7_ORYNI